MDTAPPTPGFRAGRKISTEHRVVFSDSRDLGAIPDDCIDLVVTSPPYPMIEMWDRVFSDLNPSIAQALAAKDGPSAFELMHQELDKVWRHCRRVMKPGSIACINVGDAVRTLDKDFRIYSNHARILAAMTGLGLQALPDVLWRKQTNAPNKFMGSGMLPAGAYVTYEHEYILIFRKGGRRRFDTEPDKATRAASAFFWEERNLWFSDVWTDLRGVSQDLCDQAARARSAAFPLELAFRLICMHSVYGDTVLDPFLGTGTTTAAAIAACRNSVGVESHVDLGPAISETATNAIKEGASRVQARLTCHAAFVEARLSADRAFKHKNLTYGFPVMTSQETALAVYLPNALRRRSEEHLEVTYRQAVKRGLSAKRQRPADPPQSRRPGMATVAPVRGGRARPQSR